MRNNFALTGLFFYLPLPTLSGCGEMADTLDLGSSAVRHGGSSPSTRTLLFSRSLNLASAIFNNKKINIWLL